MAAERFADVSRLLAPKSIAVIGASDQPGNFGGTAVRFLRKFDTPCAVWPVNPRRESVGGYRCYPDVASLPAPADLAILAVSARAVTALVRECAASGIGGGVAWAGGFAEGGAEGKAMQDELTAACRETGFPLLGPNCIGIIDAHAPMIASFASMLREFDTLLPGGISMVSQSGGIATMTQALAQGGGCGFRYMISVGNEAVLTVADFVRGLVDDPLTRVIALYLEGVQDGEKFRRALRAAREARKPVVVLKAGTTAASVAAAAAHTGALVGEARVWDAVLRASAAIRVASLEELLDVLMQMSGANPTKLPQGRGVATITFGGGMGVLATDQCGAAGLAIPPLSEATRCRLDGVVPPLASTLNPVDFTPQAYSDPKWLGLFPRALDIIAADPQIGSMIFTLGPMARDEDRMADMVAAFRARSTKPVLVAWPLATEAALAPLRRAGVHVCPDASRAVRSLVRLVNYAEALALPPRPTGGANDFDWPRAVPDARAGLVISEHECHAILAQAGLPVAAGVFVRREQEAMEALRGLGAPLVMKGISPAITHRAAAGLIELDIRDEAGLSTVWRRFEQRAGERGVTLDGIYLQQQIQGGLELLVSALRDPQFGTFLSLGAGGVLTELLDDVVAVQAPLNADGALDALRRLRLLRNARPDRAALRPLVDFVTRFSALAASAPWRQFTLELNPVKWTESAVVAVDGLLLIEQP